MGATAKARVQPRRQWEVLSQLHAYKLRGEVQEERRVELAAMHRSVSVFQAAPEVESEHVNREHASLGRAQRGQCFLMRIESVRGENNKRVDAGLFPGSDEVIHPAMQRLAAHGRVAGKFPPVDAIHAVFHGGRSENLEVRR